MGVAQKVEKLIGAFKNRLTLKAGAPQPFIRSLTAQSGTGPLAWLVSVELCRDSR